MAVVQNLLGLTGALSVRIGAIWHDSMTLEHALHKFCKHIFVVTGDEQFLRQGQADNRPTTAGIAMNPRARSRDKKGETILRGPSRRAK